MNAIYHKLARPGPWLLALLAVTAILLTLAGISQAAPQADIQAAPASVFGTPNGVCMVDRFNATKLANVDSLNCTSNDVQLATYTLLSGPTSCLPGDTITVGLKGEFLATSSERYDVGVFVAQDGGTPNDRGGSCYSDFLHYASTNNNTDLNLTGGAGPFYNAETNLGTADTCGDIQQGANAFLSISSISLVCQDSNGDGTADVQSCTVWDNSADGSNDPKCTSEADITAETTAKCTCTAVPISGLSVPKTGTITVNKVLTPATDSGKFNLQINGTTKATDVGNGGTTGAVTVSAGSSANPGADHTVGETAGTNTSLSDYTSSLSCLEEGGSTTPDTDGTLNVQPDDNWTCTITNTRKTGSLQISKSVTGDVPPSFSQTFSFDVVCTLAGSDTLTYNNLLINYPTATFVTQGNIPTGYSCAVTEDARTVVPGYTWGTAVITGSPAVITTKDTEYTVAVENPLTRDTGSLKVAKTLTGGPGSGTYNPDYTIAWDCNDGTGTPYDGSTTVKAGAAAVTARTGIPTGTECTVSETLPTPPTGYSFGTATYAPSATVTIANKDQEVTVTVQNTLTQPTAVTLSDLQATALSTGEWLMALLRSWLQR